jgi:hypothetical protein
MSNFSFSLLAGNQSRMVGVIRMFAKIRINAMFGNPGAVFYGMLPQMRRDRFIPANHEDIYEFVFSREQETYALVNISKTKRSCDILNEMNVFVDKGG